MLTPRYGPGIEITGRITPAYAEILTPEALAFAASCSAHSAAGARSCSRAAPRASAKLDAGGLPDFLPETRAVREADWTCGPVPADLQDRRVEITGPVDRKMIINALNSGASVFMADFEDAQHADLGQPHRGPDQPARRGPRARSTTSRPKARHYRLNDNARHAVRAPARLAPAGEARARRRRADLRRASSTSACTSSTTPRSSSRAGTRPLLLPAQAGEPPRGAAVERRLRAWRRTSSACRSGTIKAHRADRDHPGRVRDGRDPLRAARALGRPQLRPLGLHLQLHQEIPPRPRVHASPTARRSR